MLIGRNNWHLFCFAPIVALQMLCDNAPGVKGGEAARLQSQVDLEWNANSE